MDAIRRWIQEFSLIVKAFREIDSICKTNFACHTKQLCQTPIQEIPEHAHLSSQSDGKSGSRKGRIPRFRRYTLRRKKYRI